MDLNSCEWCGKIVICNLCENKGEKCDLGMKPRHFTLHYMFFVKTNNFAHVLWSQVEAWVLASFRSYMKCRFHCTMFELRPNEIPSCVLQFSSCQMLISLQRIEWKKNQMESRLKEKMESVESWGRDMLSRSDIWSSSLGTLWASWGPKFITP